MICGLIVAVGGLSTLVASLTVDPAGRPEVHPELKTQKCTKTGGCVTLNTYVVLDVSFHNYHSPSTSGHCAQADISVCPDKATCAENCAVEGADYAGSGVTTNVSSLTLTQFVTKDGALLTASPRLYLLAEDKKKYEMIQLLNQEITFDVDNSKLPCGMNGALYLSEMSPTGGMSQYNKAGAAYGTGYCDAQCFVQPWFNGEANIQKNGICCQEMDLWEGNKAAQMFTPHPCNTTGPFACSGKACDQPGTCDKWGCGYNPYSQGNKEYYGPGKTLDSTKPFTVVTQFLSSDNTVNGKLSEIRRIYIQGGKILGIDSVAPKDGLPGNSLTPAYCDVNGVYTNGAGGLPEMGNALGRGMVLAASIWYSEGDFMSWLDSGSAGPCNATEGDPKLIRQNTPDTSVTFSNIRWGDIGSTV